ncbi:MAG: hypothetical protein V7742_12320 [Halioglobus sp.]
MEDTPSDYGDTGRFIVRFLSQAFDAISSESAITAIALEADHSDGQEFPPISAALCQMRT